MFEIYVIGHFGVGYKYDRYFEDFEEVCDFLRSIGAVIEEVQLEPTGDWAWRGFDDTWDIEYCIDYVEG